MNVLRIIGKGHVGDGNFDKNRHSKYELGACQRDTVAIKERSYTVIRFTAGKFITSKEANDVITN